MSWRIRESVVLVRMIPVVPAWAKALAITAPMLRLAPLMATVKGWGRVGVNWVEDLEGVLLSLVVNFITVHVGAAIWRVR